MAIEIQDFLIIMKYKMLITDATFKVSYNHITAIIIKNQDFTNLLYVRFIYLYKIYINITIITYTTNKFKIKINIYML
jgi:hypothetical protein